MATRFCLTGYPFPRKLERQVAPWWAQVLVWWTEVLVWWEEVLVWWNEVRQGFRGRQKKSLADICNIWCWTWVAEGVPNMGVVNMGAVKFLVRKFGGELKYA